jgi:hypothetical protein
MGFLDFEKRNYLVLIVKVLKLLQEADRSECNPGLYFKFPGCSRTTVELMKWCWERRPELRPTFHDMCESLTQTCEINGKLMAIFARYGTSLWSSS